MIAFYPQNYPPNSFIEIPKSRNSFEWVNRVEIRRNVTEVGDESSKRTSKSARICAQLIGKGHRMFGSKTIIDFSEHGPFFCLHNQPSLQLNSRNEQISVQEEGGANRSPREGDPIALWANISYFPFNSGSYSSKWIRVSQCVAQ